MTACLVQVPSVSTAGCLGSCHDCSISSAVSSRTFHALWQGNLEAGAPVLNAIAYDLDVLQEMSVSLTDLCDHISDIAPTVSAYFLESALSPATKPAVKSLPSNSDQPFVVDLKATEKFIQQPPTADELREWKSAISSKSSWSQVISDAATA